MSNNAANGAEVGLGHVDQIREIIVGDEMRRFDARLQELEDRFADRLETVRSALAAEAKATEGELENRIEKLRGELKAEKTARVTAAKAAAKDLAAAVKELRKQSQAGLDERARDIDRTKVDRASLAELLEGVTAKLRSNGGS